MKVGDYVGFEGRGDPDCGTKRELDALRGIVLAGPRIKHNRSQYRVMWDGATTPKHWEPRPNGAWEDGSNIKVLSSLETKCQ